MKHLLSPYIHTIFNSFIPIKIEELDLILDQAKPLEIPRKTKLIDLGSTCDKIYIVISGCLRLYYKKEEQERNCAFFYEGLFYSSFDGFSKENQSNQILEAIEDTVCLMISYADLALLYADFPRIERLVKKMKDQQSMKNNKTISAFVLSSPEELYKEFRNDFPALINRIPEYHIASYLGISPKSFSRLKKRLYQKRTL